MKRITTILNTTVSNKFPSRKNSKYWIVTATSMTVSTEYAGDWLLCILVYTTSAHLCKRIEVWRFLRRNWGGKPGRIIELAERGTDIVLTLRGKKKARLIPYHPSVRENAPYYKADTIFGMWADREDTENVDDYVRSVRKGRTFWSSIRTSSSGNSGEMRKRKR